MNMTLHEAIEKLLELTGRSMTTQQIADELNKYGWYKKKDGSKISAFQIHGRTKNYAHLFNRDGSFVSLNEQGSSKSQTITTSSKQKTAKKATTSPSSLTKKSFAPISNSDTTILILGTMPGDTSLEQGEYYSHPRNRFWKIISKITNRSTPQIYTEKIELLLELNIGIWDVAHKVKRMGSLDMDIMDEEPNDLDDFIEKHKNLNIIAFNGIKSQILFDKYFDRKKEIKYFNLPSSSPANASIDFEKLCKLWSTIFR